MRATQAVVAVPVATLWSGPDAPRDIDAPAIADRPDPDAWLRALGVPERLDLLGRVETQALLGEPVTVLAERGEWTLVEATVQPHRRGAEGYPGWVRAAHLAPAGPAPATTAVVTARLAVAEDEDGGILLLSAGTRLAAEPSGADRVVLRAPDGAMLSLAAPAVAPVAAIGTGVLEMARSFASLPYLWGGTGGWGVDCSGLMHLAHRCAGVTIPRDADDQSAAGTAVPVGDTRPGDLVFFARPGEEHPHHVAMVSGPGRMLHSPRTGRNVEEIDAQTEPYRSELQPLARRYV